MSAERAKDGSKIAFPWTLASSAGAVVGFLLPAVPFQEVLTEYADGATFLAWFCVIASIATSVGIAQWLVLRRRISRAGGWVPATAIGVVLGPVFMTLTALILVSTYDF